MRKKQKKRSIKDLLVEYFKQYPNKDMQHGPVVDWVEARYRRIYRKKPRDTWRSIRNLHESGFLIKVKKGIYRYDPNAVEQKGSEDFTPEQKEIILRRDNYKCVLCERGKKEGVELHVDHVKPKYLGGKSTIDNGQTLCAQHNFIKKTLKQTETGKKMFIRLYELAKNENDEMLKNFCVDVLGVYEKYDVNGHIIWKK